MTSTPPSTGPSRPWLRTHALFLTALALGVAVRVVVMVAYRPALMSPDSFSYLSHAHHFSFIPRRPVGYSLFLRPILLLTDSKAVVAGLQHTIGLALAVACYVFLLRRGLPRWGATLAVLPLLFDPLQLVLEHYVLSDVLFEAMLVVACLIVLWHRRPGPWAVVVAGLLVGAAGTVRGAGDFLLVVFLVALVCLRVRWTRLVAFLVAGIVPLAAYAIGFHSEYGKYAVATDGPRFLYARLAPIVDCQDPGLRLPRHERMLCPSKPVGQRPSTRYYMWGGQRSAQYHVVPPAGMTQVQVVKDFDQRVVRSQPVVYTRAVLKDFAGGFAPTRTYEVPGYLASYWLFADHYWALDDFIARGSVNPKVLQRTSYNPTAGQFMTTYRHWVYTPGPLMAALLLVAGAATVGLGRARRSGDRVAIGLLAATCVLPLLIGAAVSGFSWRYQLPQIPLLPLAGALGLAALVRGRAPGRPPLDPPLRLLDRSAARVARLPMPAAWRPAVERAVERGRAQVVVAVLCGAAVAVLSGVLAVASGWFLPVSGVVIGVGAGVVVLVTLLVSRSAAGSPSPPDDGHSSGPAGPDEPVGQAQTGR